MKHNSVTHSKVCGHVRNHSFRNYVGYFASIFAVLMLSGCGRMKPPLPPEVFAPVAPKEVQVQAGLRGITFEWESPRKDRQGDELDSLDGYAILRRSVEEASIADSSGNKTEELFEQIGFVADESIDVRDSLRDEERAAGKSARRVDAPKEKLQHNFIDTRVEPGKRYQYLVVAVNQGGVAGKIDQSFQLTFRGESSEILTQPAPHERLIGEISVWSQGDKR